MKNNLLKFLLFTFLWMSVFSSFGQNVLCDEQHIPVSQASYFDQIIDFAKQKIGFQYGKNGLDCSGLVMKAFKTIGVNLPHSSHLQSKLGEKIKKSNAQIGDLIFFSSPKSGRKKVGHVGIITHVADQTILFIHSAVKGGVKIDNLGDAYYQKHFFTIKRLQEIVKY